MRFRSDLEQFMTLDAATITSACTRPESLRDIIVDCLDESLDLDDRADAAAASGDDELEAFYRQEAAAWRATVRVLRVMSTQSENHHASHRAAERGVA